MEFNGAYFRLRRLVGADCAGEGTLMPDDTTETVAAEAAFTVAPSLASTFTSGGRGVANVSVVDAAVAAASSAARRRMYERTEDMCSVVGGAAVVGTRPVPTSMPTPAVETAVAVAPVAVPIVASGEEEAARVAI